MKKLSIRSLFIMILALILVFTLFACNKDDDKKDDGGKKPSDSEASVENVQTFFNTLWTQSKSIGDSAIGENDDLKVDLGLTVTIATETPATMASAGSVVESIDLGVDVDLVLDRSSHANEEVAAGQKSQHTAIKARLYDPSNNENWFTVYYFFNDVDNIYIDYAGQNIQVSFDYLNDTFNENFDNFVFGTKLLKDKTLAELINLFTQQMGANWNLNALVNDVTTLLGLDLKGMIEGNSMISGVIGNLLEDEGGIDAVFDGNNLNINAILASKAIAGTLFVNDETTVNSNGFYQTKIDWSGLYSMLSSFLPNAVKEILPASTGLYLQYQLNNNALDSFAIKAVFNDLSTKVEGGKSVVPAVTINITDLEIAPATEANAITMATEKSNYTSNVVLDAEVAVDIKGVTLDATAFDSYGYARFSKVNTAIGGGLNNLVLDGTLTLSLKGKLDLKTKTDAATKTTNGTVAYAALTYKASGATTATKVLEASFADGTLAVKVNQDAKVGEVKIVDAIVRLFGDYAYEWAKNTFFGGNADDVALKAFADKFFSCNIEEELTKDPQERVITINTSFQGAAWKGVDIVGGFQNIVKGALNKLFPPKTESTPAATQQKSTISKVLDTIAAALPVITTKDNKLTLRTFTEAKTVKNGAKGYETVGSISDKMVKIWSSSKTMIDFITKKDNSNWGGIIARALTIEGASYVNTASAAITEAEFEAAKANEPNKGIVTDEEVTAAKALDANKDKTDDAIRAELQAQKDAALVLKLQKAKDAARAKAFLTDVLASTAEISLDLSNANGLEVSIDADVNASAGIGVSVKLGAKLYVETDYTNLCPTAEDELANWFTYTFVAKNQE